MLLYRILAFIFLIAGFGTVYAARKIVEKYNLDKNCKVEFKHEMSEEEQSQYRLTRTIVNVKMLGLILAIPGLVFVVLGFK